MSLLRKLAAWYLKGTIKGVHVNPTTWNGWVYGKDWRIDFNFNRHTSERVV